MTCCSIAISRMSRLVSLRIFRRGGGIGSSGISASRFFWCMAQYLDRESGSMMLSQNFCLQVRGLAILYASCRALRFARRQARLHSRQRWAFDRWGSLRLQTVHVGILSMYWNFARPCLLVKSGRDSRHGNQCR